LLEDAILAVGVPKEDHESYAIKIKNLILESVDTK